MKSLNIFTIFTCLFCCLLTVGCSEDEVPTFGGVYGIVSDSETGSALRNAEVVLSPGNLSTVTGVDGHFEFKDLDPGQVKVQVSSAGYVTDSRQVTVVPGMSSQCDISLKKEVKEARLKLSSTSLDFGSEQSSLSFSIQNTGNSGTVKWQIMDAPDWMTVSPLKGETAVGKSSAVVVTLNRALVKKDESATIRVVTDGESFPVDISAKAGTNFSFSITPENLSFGTDATIRKITLRNETYNGTLQWKIQDYSSIKWISSVHPLSGSLGKGESAEVTVTIDRRGITQKTSATIYVEAGPKVIPVIVTCDYSEKPKAYVEVSPSGQIDFGMDKTSATVTLKAHYGSFAYTAELEGSPVWVSLDKTSGSLEDYETSGKTEPLTLSVDRTKMSSSEAESALIVRAGNDVLRVALKAGREQAEDYSSATVISCDSRIDVKILSCKWSGTSVVFNYSLTNTGLGDISDFSLGSSSYTTIYDDKGNEYTYWYITFRDSSTDSNSYKTITTRFPEGPECKGSITLKNVPSDVKNITYLLHAYIHYGTPLSGDRISFKNVPIFR